MCGIVGSIHTEKENPVSRKLIEAMCSRIIHRGPDSHGYYVKGPAGLGMRRLSIIDLETGKQPIANEDETVWIVFNGEIYNYRQLSKELVAKGHRFRTTSDTEVILHLYEEMGVECVNRLRGMFAFAIWDERQHRLTLARDRIGIKPLYYALTPRGLVFGSEIKAILADPAVSRDIDPHAVVEYFTHLCVPGNLSIYRMIRKLPPAHTLTFQGGRLVLSRYWHIQPQPRYGLPEKTWIEMLRDKLQDAVQSHLVADVPVGAFLSGGLDSGAMTALMAQGTTEPVQTFTVGFALDAGRFDERSAAKTVADKYGTLHNECLLEADVEELLPQIVAAFDEPFADSSAIPNWLVCRETARHIKVVLSGLGGDELFGGYERYVGIRLGEVYHRIPRALRNVIGRLVDHLPVGDGLSYRNDRIKRFVAAGNMVTADRYRSFITAFSDPLAVLNPEAVKTNGHAPSCYDSVIGNIVSKDVLDIGLFIDLYMYLPDDLLPLSDRISMAHSLEVRVPFVDHELVEFAASMPADLKVNGFKKKFIFSKAIAPWLPVAHFKRPKQGFSVPIAGWLRGPLRDMLLDLNHESASGSSPWLDKAAVRTLIDEHLAGQHNHESRLWAILCFREWERQSNSVPVDGKI